MAIDVVTYFEQAFLASLPRMQTACIDGSDLTIVGIEGDHVRISDGYRSAPYRQAHGDALDLSALSIVPDIEAGRCSEVMALTLTDGIRIAVFVPARTSGLH